jgi:hypothetical protein
LLDGQKKHANLQAPLQPGEQLRHTEILQVEFHPPHDARGEAFEPLVDAKLVARLIDGE